MARIFVYDGRQIPDPDPRLSVDEVRKRLADFFPELTNSDVQETKQGDDTVHTFTRRLGTKGMKRRRKVCGGVTSHSGILAILRRVPAKRLAVFDLARELITPEGEVSLDLAIAREVELSLALDEAEAYSKSTKVALEALRRIPAR